VTCRMHHPSCTKLTTSRMQQPRCNVVRWPHQLRGRTQRPARARGVQDILHIFNKKLVHYVGNYSTFEKVL
jgi:hypothetical protein